MKTTYRILSILFISTACLVGIIATYYFIENQNLNHDKLLIYQGIVIMVFLLISGISITLIEARKHKKTDIKLKKQWLNQEELILKRTQSLKESEERFKILIEQTPGAVHIMDTKGKFLEVNQDMCDMHGYTRNEMLSMSVGDIDHAFLSREDEVDLWKKQNTKKRITFEVEHIHKDGTIFPVEISLIVIEIKGEKVFFGLGRDISSYKEAFSKLEKTSEQLKASEEKYRTVVENASEGIFIIQEGHIVFANQAVIDILGYNQEELKQGHFIELMHEEDRKIAIQNYKKRLEGQNIPVYHARVKAKSGSYVTVEVNATNYTYNGKPATLNFTNDITEKVKAEKQLNEYTKELEEVNATKDKFFSIIAHDLKSPFNAILGFSEILLKNHKKYDEVKRGNLIKSVNNSAVNAFKLLENLLTWSLAQSGRIKYLPQNINFKILLSETVSALKGQANKKNIQILDTIYEKIIVFADKNMLETILRNLISNAIKFTNTSGNIIISSKKTDSNFLEISVEDTGVGISKDTIDDLFRIDKNTSTQGTENEAGTGLGLILCKEFVEKHNGEIWIESKIEKGSKFIFTIPNIYN